MSDREAMKLALKALEYYQHRRLEWDYADEQAITALRTRLAAPEPEPVAWVWLKDGIPVNVFLSRANVDDRYWLDKGYSTAPLYADPPAAAPEKRHPGYVIGDHWLETAYERICAGEAEADVLRDYGLWRCANGIGPAIGAAKEPATEPAIRARGEVPQ